LPQLRGARVIPKSNTAPFTTEYRAYLLDENGRVLKREDFEADNDTQAMESAGRYLDGHDVEVWQLERVIGLLKRK
jgi:hypothetical protein